MRKELLIALAVFSIMSCKKGKAPQIDEPVITPAKAVLVAPAKNEACIEGTSVSA